MDARTALEASTVRNAMDVDSASNAVNALTARHVQSATGALVDAVSARVVLIAGNVLHATGALGDAPSARDVLDAKAVLGVVVAATVQTAQTASLLLHRVHCRFQVHLIRWPRLQQRTARR